MMTPEESANWLQSVLDKPMTDRVKNQLILKIQ